MSRLSRLAVLFFLALFATVFHASSAIADTFELTDGETIKGELIEEMPEAYRIRTPFGVVDLEKDRVVNMIKGPSPWEQYAAKRRKTRDTADAHYQLAKWCATEELWDEWALELEIAIELDPDHAASREALGHVRNKNGKWVLKEQPGKLTEAEREQLRELRQAEKDIERRVTEWFRKVKSLHKGRLKAKGKKSREKFEDGRAQIMAIDDSLAIPALAGVLMEGSAKVRYLLVEALSQFKNEDDATMNLIILTILDPNEAVREAAAKALKDREDDRIVWQLIAALSSQEEGVVRNAATALGILEAGEAIPSLINALIRNSVKGKKKSYTVETSLLGIWRSFRRLTPIPQPAVPATLTRPRYRYAAGVRPIPRRRVGLSVAPTRRRPRSAGGCPSLRSRTGLRFTGTLVPTTRLYRTRPMNTLRTEVQDALIRLTGENHGFDRAKWQRWYDGHHASTRPKMAVKDSRDNRAEDP